MMPEPVFRFAEALRALLVCKSPAAFERVWECWGPGELGWEALSRAWRRDRRLWEGALDEVDGLLLRLLDRSPVLTDGTGAPAIRVRTFMTAELERLQHATAAALVAQRFGVAGLRTVVDDEHAPLVRRYFAFFALAERHPAREWPLFKRHLTPAAHHAFVAAAVEAARFYPQADAAERLIWLFNQIRSDLQLREFLGPRLLESLFVLGKRETLPFFRELLTAGHTHSEPEYCEVTHALVMVRRFTGEVEPSVKFSDPSEEAVSDLLSRAENSFGAESEELHPVTVI